MLTNWDQVVAYAVVSGCVGCLFIAAVLLALHDAKRTEQQVQSRVVGPARLGKPRATASRAGGESPRGPEAA